MMNLDMPEEAIRSLVFCGANQFHLFVLSLPGQVLLDHCAELANNMYILNIHIWYVDYDYIGIDVIILLLFSRIIGRLRSNYKIKKRNQQHNKYFNN